MFLVLATLILRPVGFKYRSKMPSMVWRSFWDWALFAGGVVPSLVFGVAFGNLFLGVPFTFDDDLRMHSTITLVSLLNPFALLSGLISLSMMVLHGAAWLNLKTEGAIKARAQTIIPIAALAFAGLFAIAGFWVWHIAGFQIVGQLAHDGPSNPLIKTVTRVAHGWFANEAAHPWLWLTVVLAYIGALVAVLLRGRPGLSFVASGAVALGTIATAGVALIPISVAVFEQSQREPYGLGCILKQAYACGYAWSRRDIFTDNHRVHRLGVPGSARTGSGSRYYSQFKVRILGAG